MTEPLLDNAAVQALTTDRANFNRSRIVGHQKVALWSLIPADKKICTRCNNMIELPNLDIHHVNGKRWDNTPGNLQLLHRRCHIANFEGGEKFVGTSYRLPPSLMMDIEREAKDGVSLQQR
jgi:hypothetical protein